MRTNLKYNDNFIVNGKKLFLCTLQGFAAQEGLTVEEFYEKYPAQKANDNRPSGLQGAAVLTDSKDYYEAEEAKYKNAPVVSDGEEVLIEGKVYVTKYKGNYSNAVVFNLKAD